jgi:hypothetical protein
VVDLLVRKTTVLGLERKLPCSGKMYYCRIRTGDDEDLN